MTKSSRFAKFHPISVNRLYQEREHDTYKSTGKLPEPAQCPECGAIFHEGRWQWLPKPAIKPHMEMCPACHRIHDKYPAAFVTLAGPFLNQHKEEVLRMVSNEEQREKAEHPLKRIMAIEDQDGELLITTTDIHLARGIGEALKNAYQGNLEYHYNAGVNQFRVHWEH